MLLLGTLQESGPYSLELVTAVADHAYGMLEIFTGLVRMEQRGKNARLAATSVREFAGNSAISAWRKALGYRIKSKDLAPHAQWILDEFKTFIKFHDSFSRAVDIRKESRFV